MPAKVEEYNFFICPECDKDGANKLSPDDFQKHLVEVHNIKDKKGNRQMVMHVDAAGWFSWVCNWTIGGKPFVQHIKQARSRKFGADEGGPDGV